MEDVQVAIGDKVDVKVTQINLEKGQYRVMPTSKVTVTPSADGGDGGGGRGRGRGRGGGGRGGGGRGKLPRSG